MNSSSSPYCSLITEKILDLIMTHTINVNLNLFAYILHYLQHEVLSVIYKKSHRFDYAFYLTLQRKTLYFEIELLYK